MMAAAVHDEPIDQQQDDRADDCRQPGADVEELIERVRVEKRSRKEASEHSANDPYQRGDDDPARIVTRRIAFASAPARAPRN
jgi:hypothetical protein